MQIATLIIILIVIWIKLNKSANVRGISLENLHSHSYAMYMFISN